MKLEVLLATMYQEDISIYHKMNIKTDAVIINQCDKESYEEFNINGKHIKFVCTKERGLSRSRNMALKYAKGDICLIADDDVTYYDDYESTILTAFNRYPKAQIISFCAQRKDEMGNRIEHNYPTKDKRINFWTAGSRTSFEIAIRRRELIGKDIWFDVNFGTGSEFFPGGGEETIFCRDCVKSKVKIIFVAKYIEDVSTAESTWFRGYNENFFIDKGAGYTRGTGKFVSLIMIISFAIRKYKYYGRECSKLLAVRYMMDGRRTYLQSLI